MNYTDIHQGALGDCWFLAAAASLAQHPQLMQRVVPAGQSFDLGDYAGIFHFQFWQYGKWVDVVVDDKLPVKNGELAFVHSEGHDEFWPALLEKAYAKFNGSYGAIDGGFSNEAFVTFTGGIGECITLEKSIASPDFFKIIKTAVDRGSLIGTGTTSDEGEAHGLVKEHAYSVTGIDEVNYKGERKELLRLRNPWGKSEWTGRWSDASPLWLDLDPGLQKTLQVKKDDGEFWMEINDFVKYFDDLQICSLSPDSLFSDKTASWKVTAFHGRWISGYNAGGCDKKRENMLKNPQFHVRLREADEYDLKEQHPDPKCTLLVSLIQKDRRRGGKTHLPIGFQIYKIPTEYLELKHMSQRRKMLFSLHYVDGSEYMEEEVNTKRFELPPGDYLIVPSTDSPNEESEFILRVFTEKTHAFHEIDDEICADLKTLGMGTSVEIGEEVENIFLQFAGQDQEIGVVELKKILAVTLAREADSKPERFQLETCRQMIRLFDYSKNGRLSLEEFKTLWERLREWKAIFTEHDRDKSGNMDAYEMRLALATAGFHLNNQFCEIITNQYRNRGLFIDLNSFLSCLAHLTWIFRQCKTRDRDGTGIVTMAHKEWLELITAT
nr:calpain-12 [Chrysemys picta bellii]